MVRRRAQRGQVLVLFVLFLLVLLGISALAIDYASWLLTDRALQNYSDHAALAGASAFADRTQQGSCSGGSGATDCNNARAQAWASLNSDLGLGLDPEIITCLATAGGGDSPAAGELDASRALTGGCTSKTADPFGYKIWVATPPPNAGRYTDFGGAYSLNFGIVWVRVDRPVRSFLGGALGINPADRTGWSTAGSLPTDFALQVFCRDNIAPQNGVCVNSAGLTIDGQGGIRLIRGDIASNESLKVTAQGGQGVILEAGNQYLVNGVCGSSSWNCPPATTGGISDGVNPKNAFYMAPLPVPHYASPLDDVTISHQDCQSAGPTALCVPNRPYTGSGAGTPGDWRCETTGYSNLCGLPTVTTVSGVSTIECEANPGGISSRYLVPISDGSVNGFNGSPVNTSKKLYTNVDDDANVATPPANDTTDPPINPPNDYVYTQNNIQAGRASTVSFNLRPPFGRPQPGSTVISYTVVKMNGSSIDTSGTGNPVTATVSVLQNGVVVAGGTDVARTLTATPTFYSFSVNGITDFTTLSVRIRFDNTASGGTSADRRGGAVGFIQAYTQDLDPALPAMVPPGYYHSVTIPDGGCAIMDPTAQYYGYEYPALMAYQKPGIYRFGTGNDAAIDIGDAAYLIGDGVTLVFNPEFPDPTGGRGVIIGGDGAMVLNTSRVIGTPPCTPTEAETATYNPSAPLSALPYSSVCAAWGIDSTTTVGVYPGSMAWPLCIDTSLAQCVTRSSYNPTPDYRGITFYFSPAVWPATTIRDRFEMGGGSGAQPGIAFRGVLYAPYDNVKITGGNGFNTVGQVLAWSAKFNGGSAYIDLDYPYEFVPAAPYLLEPTINR